MRLSLAVLVLCSLSTGATGAEGGRKKNTEIFPEKPDAHYVQDEQRVDPFTLGKPPVAPKEEARGAPGDRVPLPDYALASRLLASDRTDRLERCLALCRRGMPALKSLIAGLERQPGRAEELGRQKVLLEKFVLLEATAARLKKLADIRAEFSGFELEVSGIVRRGRGASTAVVGGDLVREGTVLRPAGRKGHIATVRRITAKSVIVLYRGVEIELEL